MLDEVERFGSRVLVIAQGRLAAEGDFRAIRDLMDDRPHRLRVATDARRAARRRRCSPTGVASGVRASTAPTALEVETTDVHGFRRAVAVVARDRGARARRGRARSTTTSTASSATWWAGRMIATDLPGHPAHPGARAASRRSALLGVGRARGRPGHRRSSDVVDRLDAGTNMINAFGLSLYAPVVDAGVRVGVARRSGRGRHPRLPLAAAGGPVADRGRHLPGHPEVRCPLVLVPLVAGGRADRRRPRPRAGARSSSATLAVVAYGGIFTWLGLRVRRALVWGLAYILLWEGFVAIAGEDAPRLAVRAYTRSVLSTPRASTSSSPTSP